MSRLVLALIHRVLALRNVPQDRHDALADLFSASYLTETCARELNRARRFGRKMALLLIELDELADLGTIYGPQACEAVIRSTARIIRQATREYDVVAELGSGMFGVLLPETDVAQAQVVVERMRRSIAHRHELPGSLEQVRVTVSIGTVIGDGQAESAAQLFALAETTLASAKRVGGNRSEYAELSCAPGEPSAEASLVENADDGSVEHAESSSRRGASLPLLRDTTVCVLLGVAVAAIVEWLTGASLLAPQPLLGCAAIAIPPMVMGYLSRKSVARAVDSARQLRTLNQQLEHQAFHDPLTKLANRALFLDRLEQAIGRAEQDVAVMFLDLDNFKTVNDTLGHAAGDALLTIVTQRLRQCVRWQDTIARLGGDEFTVLLENVRDLSQVARSAERIAEALSEPFVLDGHEARVSASIGIALDTDRSHAPDDLLREADLAMYRAKSGGKSRYEIFDPGMGSQVTERLELEADLRAAAAHGELELVYSQHAHFDAQAAAVRWRHPRHGLFEDSALLTLAEESGLAREVGRWTLRQACADALELRSAVSVAVANAYLEYAAVVHDVADALQRSGLPPAQLLLHLDRCDADQLQALHALGISIAIGQLVLQPRPTELRVAA